MVWGAVEPFSNCFAKFSSKAFPFLILRVKQRGVLPRLPALIESLAYTYGCNIIHLSTIEQELKISYVPIWSSSLLHAWGERAQTLRRW